VSAGEELEKLKTSIKQELNNLKDGNENIKINVWGKEELYWGEKLNELPDMIFNVQDYLFINSLKTNGNVVFSPPTGLWKRIHDFKGVLLMSGENILQDRTFESNLYDIVPTVLYLMGCPVPDDLDGKILKDTIIQDYFKSNPPQYYIKEETEATPEQRLSHEEEQEVMDSLKGLGYIE
jgi:predicted AlkP superfamily phosphohydrolase/phosphomutase